MLDHAKEVELPGHSNIIIMAKKKVRQTLGEETSLDSGSASQPSVPSPTAQASQASSSSGPKPRSRISHAAPTTAVSPSLVICRNKYVYGNPFFI